MFSYSLFQVSFDSETDLLHRLLFLLIGCKCAQIVVLACPWKAKLLRIFEGSFQSFGTRELVHIWTVMTGFFVLNVQIFVEQVSSRNPKSTPLAFNGRLRFGLVALLLFTAKHGTHFGKLSQRKHSLLRLQETTVGDESLIVGQDWFEVRSASRLEHNATCLLLMGQRRCGD